MVLLGVVAREEFPHRATDRFFAEQAQPVEALGFQ